MNHSRPARALSKGNGLPGAAVFGGPEPESPTDTRTNWEKSKAVRTGKDWFFRWFFGPLLLLAGIPVALWGGKYWKFYKWIVGGISGLFWGGFIIAGVSDYVWGDWSYLFWMIFIVVTVIASAFTFGCLSGKIIGGLLGNSIFLTFAMLVEWAIQQNSFCDMPGWVRLATAIISPIVGFVIGSCWPDKMVPWGTACIGSLVFIAGVGSMSGFFPFIIYASPIDYLWVWWAFFLLGAGFAVFAWRFQIWLKEKTEKERIGRNDEDVILDNFM